MIPALVAPVYCDENELDMNVVPSVALMKAKVTPLALTVFQLTSGWKPETSIPWGAARETRAGDARAAEAARTKAAQKVVNVPPVAAQRRQGGPNAVKTRANQEALTRLNRSGSIKDAMAVDFD